MRKFSVGDRVRVTRKGNPDWPDLRAELWTGTVVDVDSSHGVVGYLVNYDAEFLTPEYLRRCRECGLPTNCYYAARDLEPLPAQHPDAA